MLKGIEFEKVNKSIIKLIANFDSKDEVYPVEFSFKKIYQDKNIISFSLEYNISFLTEKYFNKYYTVSLNKDRELTLLEYLEHEKISKDEIINAINHSISLCIPNKSTSPDYCLDMAIQDLIQNNNRINYSNISSFLLIN